MKIREAREIALEETQCGIEVAKAEVLVLSRSRDELILEASSDRDDQWRLKNVMRKIAEASKELRKYAVRQKRLRVRTKMDDQEIKNAFELEGVKLDFSGTWDATIAYRDEKHVFKCYYQDFFLESKNIWSSRSAFKRKKGHHIPDYLVRHVWRELVDPWSVLTPITCLEIYDRLLGHAWEHRYLSSAISCLRGRRWIYGIGRVDNRVRIVIGQSSQNKIYCMELDDTMGLAFLPSPNSGGDDLIFCGATDEKRMRMPIVGCGSEPLIRARKGGGLRKRDYNPYEKIAWNWLHQCSETTIRKENHLLPSRIRDCYRKGQLWQPE